MPAGQRSAAALRPGIRARNVQALKYLIASDSFSRQVPTNTSGINDMSISAVPSIVVPKCPHLHW